MAGAAHAGTADAYGWAPTIVQSETAWAADSWADPLEGATLDMRGRVPEWALEAYLPRNGDPVQAWAHNGAGTRWPLLTGRVDDVTYSGPLEGTVATPAPLWLSVSVVSVTDAGAPVPYVYTLAGRRHTLAAAGVAPRALLSVTIPASPRAGYGLVLGLPAQCHPAALPAVLPDAGPPAGGRCTWTAVPAAPALTPARGAIPLAGLPAGAIVLSVAVDLAPAGSTSPLVWVSPAIVPLGMHTGRAWAASATDAIGAAGGMPITGRELPSTDAPGRWAQLGQLLEWAGLTMIAPEALEPVGSTVRALKAGAQSRTLLDGARGAGHAMGRRAAGHPAGLCVTPRLAPLRVLADTSPLTLSEAPAAISLPAAALTDTDRHAGAGALVTSVEVAGYVPDLEAVPIVDAESVTVLLDAALAAAAGPVGANVETDAWARTAGELGAHLALVRASDLLSTSAAPGVALDSSLRVILAGVSASPWTLTSPALGYGAVIGLTGTRPADLPGRWRLAGARLLLGGGPAPVLELDLGPAGTARGASVTGADLRALAVGRRPLYTLATTGTLTIADLRGTGVTP